MNDYMPLLIVVLAIVAVWIAASSYLKKRRANTAAAVVGNDYGSFLLAALANAARIDGRVDEAERTAMADAMSQATGAPFSRQDVDGALSKARLSKDELVAYLASNGRQFSLDQKSQLLKAVLSVAMADGRFDEREHAIYLDYIAAVGFDHRSAPQMLQEMVRDLAAGKYS
jgi:uncharacterized membrane protein YebE (DUF533 family)